MEVSCKRLRRKVNIDLTCLDYLVSSSNLLTIVHKSYLRPVFEYGGELLATASGRSCDKVDKIQNKTLRLITSATYSTPITAINIQSALKSLNIHREKHCEKYKRLPVKNWQQAVTALKR